MLRCRIKAGTPSSPNTPVLITNPTGMWAKADRSSPRSHCDRRNPGAINRTSVAAKMMGGKASKTFLRGRSVIAATSQESNTSASGDFGRARPSMSARGDFLFTGLPYRAQTLPSAKVSILYLRSHPGDTWPFFPWYPHAERFLLRASNSCVVNFSVTADYLSFNSFVVTCFVVVRLIPHEHFSQGS